jgi:hypothetical protein
MNARGTFAKDQTEQLLKPIHTKRVLTDGKGHSHVSQQDITAHLIRMFEFGNFDTEVLDASLVFETERADKDGNLTNRWDVCYRAMVRLTIRNREGELVCYFEDGSTATAQNQTRGDGHDLAYKSAISLSKKRAAINLGDQFGLSLYNKGQVAALVLGTLGTTDKSDIQEDVPQQVSLGNDEIDLTPETPTAPTAWAARVAKAADRAELSEIHSEAVQGGWALPEVMAAITKRTAEL